MSSKRIAVLGGGMSGLTSVKACLEEGLEPVCFESTDNVGGLWRYRPQDLDGVSSLPKSTIINSSKEPSAFSDFPPPKDFPNYMHNRYMFQYFNLYADHFGLRKYIKFNRKVTWVSPTDDYNETGRWSVTVTKTTGNDSEPETEIFDGVMICTGHHVYPYLPKFEGMNDFRGKVLHTHSYKVPNEFEGNRVLVIGNGNSGSDAAVELSSIADQVYLSTRRGFWIRYRLGPRGYPGDLTVRTRASVLNLLPFNIKCNLQEKRAMEILDYDRYGLKASHRILSQHPTVSDALPNKILSGSVKIKGPIAKFVPAGVIFEGEEENMVPLDAVILATGYRVNFPFLDPSIAKLNDEECELYLYVFPPRLKHSTLAFIGNVQPIGPMFLISELQARWYAQVFNDHREMENKRGKKIAIIGGGESGLTSIKACLEEQLQPVCFEKSQHIGGLWNYTPEDVEGRSSVMRSTIINTSKEVHTYSDFQVPDHFPNFMHNKYVLEYIRMYADHFGLEKYVKFNHEVKWLTPAPDFETTGQWLLKLKKWDPQTKAVEEWEEIFDGVMICTGHHVDPHIPQYEGLDKFKGKVSHSHSYKVPDGFRDKKVMVMGNGNSGVDIAVELSAVAEQVYLTTRRGFWILNRVGKRGYPIDMQFPSRFTSMFLPESLKNYLSERNANNLVDHAFYGLTPAHRFWNQHPTVSDALPNRILSGTVLIKGPVSKFTEDGVVFKGEEDKVVPLDAVVMSTGYNVSFPFLDPKIAKMDNQTCELFMFAFPPKLSHPTLVFIGNVQPIGSLFPVSELQARWYVQVFVGKVKLPSKEDMMADIENRLRYNREHFISGPRHVTEVIFAEYMDAIAKIMGVKPGFWRMLLTDPKLFLAYYFGPHLPYQYRLYGPHSWSGARRAMLTYHDRIRKALESNACAKKVPSKAGLGSEQVVFWIVAVIILSLLVRFIF